MDGFEGFREFVAGYGGRLSRFAYLLTGDHHAAEDLMQSALAKAVARWRKVARYERPEAYVRRLMVNEHISGWRRRQRLVEHPVERVPELAASDRSEETVRKVLLERALAQLTARQRAVVVLRFYHDLSEAEVAAELGCSVGTVKSQNHHALARLREVAPELAELLRTGAEVSA